jgi:hypothetical protein
MTNTSPKNTSGKIPYKEDLPDISPGTIFFTVFTGILNPTPTFDPVGLRIIVLMPTTSPFELRSGPPELPGLIAASV